MASRLAEIEGVAAVALGGSWARREAHPNSDIDLGIYYRPECPPSIQALRELAWELDDRHLPDAVTGFGEWGPWIDGGGWLKIQNRPVDWLYRDLDLISRVIDECRAGETSCHYQPGHPHGFHTHIYLGEIHHCVPLYDLENELSTLIKLTADYPPLLKHSIVDKYLWEAGFALDTSLKSAARGDVFYVTGCLFRCAACLVQVLFALNERYFVNEKGSVGAVDSLEVRPPDFGETVSTTLARPGKGPVELRASADRFTRLIGATKELAASLPREG